MQTNTKTTMQARGQRKFGSVVAGGIGLSLLALTFTFGSSAAHAQDGPPPGQDGGGFGGGPGGGQGGFGGGPGGGGFGGQRGGMNGMRPGGGGISQMPFDLLVSTLSLTDDQQGKIAIILLEARDANSPEGGPGGFGGPGGQGGGQRQQGGTNGRAAELATQKKVEVVLNDDQVTKLKSLIAAMRTLQSAGIPARATTKLNLTSDQITKLAEAAPAAPQAGQGGGQGGQGGFEAMQKTMDAARSTVKSTLTSDQLSQVSTYLNRQMGQGGQGGFGGRGGQGGQGGFGGGPGGGGPDGGPGGDGPPPSAGGGNF